MNNPGVWVFGSAEDDDRNMGMGVVIVREPCRRAPMESARESGMELCGVRAPFLQKCRIRLSAAAPPGIFSNARLTINGKSWPDTNPLFTVQEGKRYRLLLNNNSGDLHPGAHVHLAFNFGAAMRTGVNHPFRPRGKLDDVCLRGVLPPWGTCRQSKQLSRRGS
jgi:hypothetical protein